MPLESLFSEQVTQPYLNEPFPIRPFEPHDDRLFRHITFPEKDDDLTLRIRAIDRNYIIESSVVQKHVPINIEVSEGQQEIFRVKAVLAAPEYGIDESHWVMNKSLGSQEAKLLNQYRIRGVSKENWNSDWVYSELRDLDNDLIIYNMLYDVLDLLLSVHDDQIDYLMDYIVNDTFIDVIGEKLPKFSINLDAEEFKTATIEELLTLIANQSENNQDEKFVAQLGENFIALADELKKEFKESIMSSSEEFSELYRIYKLFDQYKEKQIDALSLLMEIFLDDRLDKLVQKTNIEVLLQNDEEMGIYLNGRYKFDIKSELIDAVYSASPDDHFVTSLSDAVQLISEPVVFESLVYQQDETVEKFLRLVLSELYAPFVAIDSRLVELEHALEDAHKFEPSGSIVEFATMVDGDEVRTMMLYDVAETLLQGDLDLHHEYEVIILDKVLKTMTDSRKALLIDYNLDEFMKILLDLGESFQNEYKKQFDQQDEQKSVGLSDQTKINSSNISRSLKESYQATLNDGYHLSLLKDSNDISDSTSLSLIDQLQYDYSEFKSSIDDLIETTINDVAANHLVLESINQEDSISIKQIDNGILKDILEYYQTREKVYTGLSDSHQFIDIVTIYQWLEDIKAHPEEMYYNLFKHYLREPNKYPILEQKDVDIATDLRDKFFMDGTDTVQYALGDMGEGWPLGVFKLGINTLKGEVQDS